MESFSVSVSGTSHGPGIEALIENCPSGVWIDEDFVASQLALRRPGQLYTTPRQETEDFEILSGVALSGDTTGEDLHIFIPNRGQHTQAYDKLRDVLRPGHGITMQMLRDRGVEQSGGGAASARLTAGYVAAGAVAQLVLETKLPDRAVQTTACIEQVGRIDAEVSIPLSEEQVYKSPVRCPDPIASQQIEALLKSVQAMGDSVGGAVLTMTTGFPGAIGDRPGLALDAHISSALMTINAVKGVYIGNQNAHEMFGSEYIDEIEGFEGTDLHTVSNNSGGILGGLSMGGEPIVTHTYFKPTSSIRRSVSTVNLAGERTSYELGSDDRHDPCVAIRGVEVTKAMQRIALTQALLDSSAY